MLSSRVRMRAVAPAKWIRALVASFCCLASPARPTRRSTTARFDDVPGKWMFHCRILDYEDNGMMGVLEVR